MRNMHFIKLAALSCAALLLGSCSSCSEVESGKKGTNSNTTVVKPKQAANPGSTSNSNSNGNATLKTYPGLENGKQPTMDPSKVKKIDTSKMQKGIPAKKMPDNSEMKVTMQGSAFLETRRFLNHPQLEKIERLSKSAKDVQVTVYLRNGKQIKLKDGDLKDYKKDSAQTILDAAGVERPKQDPKKAAEKKREILKNRPIRKAPSDQ